MALMDTHGSDPAWQCWWQPYGRRLPLPTSQRSPQPPPCPSWTPVPHLSLGQPGRDSDLSPGDVAQPSTGSQLQGLHGLLTLGLARQWGEEGDAAAENLLSGGFLFLVGDNCPSSVCIQTEVVWHSWKDPMFVEIPSHSSWPGPSSPAVALPWVQAGIPSPCPADCHNTLVHAYCFFHASQCLVLSGCPSSFWCCLASPLNHPFWAAMGCRPCWAVWDVVPHLSWLLPEISISSRLGCRGAKSGCIMSAFPTYAGRGQSCNIRPQPLQPQDLPMRLPPTTALTPAWLPPLHGTLHCCTLRHCTLPCSRAWAAKWVPTLWRPRAILSHHPARQHLWDLIQCPRTPGKC